MDQKSKTKKAWWKPPLIILGVFSLVILVISLYLQAKWKPLIKEKITVAVLQASDSLYRLQYEDIAINLIAGSATFHQAQLIPDTLLYERLKAKKSAPVHLFRVETKALKINGAQLLSAYFNKNIKLKNLTFVEPKIWMHYTRVGKAVDTTTKELTLYQKIASTLNLIQVAEVRIQNADFEYYTGKRLSNKVNRLNISIRDILIDSASQYDTTRVGYARHIAFNLGNYESITPDKMYKIKIDSVNGNVMEKRVDVKGFKLIPQLSDLAFSRKYATQKDRYDLSFDKIQIAELDFIRLNQDGELRARKINLGPAKVAVFLNRELPPPAIDKGRNFPHNALKRLEINTKIDSVVLDKVQIAYTEYNPETKSRGTLHLGNLSGPIINLTNDSLSLSQNHFAQANLTASLMNKGNLKVQIKFNLTDPHAAFSYSGGIKNYNLAHLNALSTPLGQVQVESGQVHALTFQMQGNTRGATGQVNFLYSNLKANLTKKDEQGQTKKKGLLSFVANAVLIKDSNPDPKKPERTAQVQWDRVPQASFFNLMWKSIFLGIRDIVGIGMIPMKNPGDK